MIPKVIHRLWLGPRPMPERFRFYGREWQRLNPSWAVRDWSWQNLPEDLACSDVLDDIWSRSTRGDSIEMATALADVIDYELVCRFGGIYVNTDLQPVRCLPPVLGESAWVARESGDRIVNAAMGGPAGHPFWRSVVDNLPHRYWRMRAGGNENMVELTGPCFLTDMVTDTPEGKQVRVVPQEVFCPVSLGHVPMGGTAEGLWSMDTLPPETVAVHHWDHRRTGRINEVR